MREVEVRLHSFFTFAQDAPDALPKGTVSTDEEARWASKLVWMLQRKG
jgi:hypothetical protein